MDIDTDLLESIRRRAQDSGRSFKEELNFVIQRGLRAPTTGARPVYSLPTFSMGVLPGIDLTKANQLAGELEDEEIIRKMREGR